MNFILSTIIGGFIYDLLKAAIDETASIANNNNDLNKMAGDLNLALNDKYNDGLEVLFNYAMFLDTKDSIIDPESSLLTQYKAYQDNFKMTEIQNSDEPQKAISLLSIDDMQSTITKYPFLGTYFSDNAEKDIDALINDETFWYNMSIVALSEAYSESGIDDLFFADGVLRPDIPWMEVKDIISDSNNLNPSYRSQVLTEFLDNEIQNINADIDEEIQGPDYQEAYKSEIQSLYLRAFSTSSDSFIDPSQTDQEKIGIVLYGALADYINTYHPKLKHLLVPDDELKSESYIKASYALLFPTIFGKPSANLWEKTLLGEKDKSILELSLEEVANGNYIDWELVLAFGADASDNYPFDISDQAKASIRKVDQLLNTKNLYTKVVNEDIKESAAKQIERKEEQNVLEDEIEQLTLDSRINANQLSQTIASLEESEARLKAIDENSKFIDTTVIELVELNSLNDLKTTISFSQERLRQVQKTGLYTMPFEEDEYEYLFMPYTDIMGNENAQAYWKQLLPTLTRVFSEMQKSARNKALEEVNRSESDKEKYDDRKKSLELDIGRNQFIYRNSFGNGNNYITSYEVDDALSDLISDVKSGMSEEEYSLFMNHISKMTNITLDDINALRIKYIDDEKDLNSDYSFFNSPLRTIQIPQEGMPIIPLRTIKTPQEGMPIIPLRIIQIPQGGMPIIPKTFMNKYLGNTTAIVNTNAGVTGKENNSPVPKNTPSNSQLLYGMSPDEWKSYLNRISTSGLAEVKRTKLLKRGIYG